MRTRILADSLLLAALVLAACGSSDGSSGARRTPDDTVTLVTHDSFAVSKPVLRAFTKQTGITVKVLKNGDAGAALNQAILTKDEPLGDAFFGVDNTFLSRALDAGHLRAVHGARARPGARRAAARRPQPGHPDRLRRRLRQLRQGSGSTASSSPVPRTLDDLADARSTRAGSWSRTRPRRRPASRSSSPPSREYGPDGWDGYWQRLRANDVKVVDGWEQAYNNEFSAGSGQGDYPLVVSYASSPPVEVYLRRPDARRPRRPASLDDTCFRQVEFAGVLRGRRAPGGRAAARRLHAQRAVPGRHPARRCSCSRRVTGTPLPTVFTEVRQRPATTRSRSRRREIGAQPRRLDQAVDRHRAAVTATRAPRAGRRAGDSLLVAIPVVFLGVFFVWPVVAILGRGLAPGGALDLDPLGDVLTDPGLRHVAWFTVWQAALSTVLTLRDRDPGRVRAQPVPVPRPRARARARDRPVRAARPSSSAPRSARSGSPGPSRRSCSPTCSSTTRSSCAPSAGSGRTSTRARRRPRRCSARTGGGRSSA